MCEISQYYSSLYCLQIIVCPAELIQTVLLYIDKMPAVNITQDHSATAVQMNHRTGHTYCMGLTLQPSYIHENMTIRSHLHTFTIIT